jgi:hypothetical protein
MSMPIDGDYRPFAFGSQTLLSEALHGAAPSPFEPIHNETGDLSDVIAMRTVRTMTFA